MANPVVVYSKTPITKLDDFKGMKIRYASAANKVMLDALGATTAADPAAGVAGRARQGHHRTARRSRTRRGLAYDLGAVSPSTRSIPAWRRRPSSLVMNPAKYNSLPPDLKALLDKDSRRRRRRELRQGLGGAGEVRPRARDDQEGPQINTLSDADIAKLKALAKKQIDEEIAKLEKDGKPAKAFMAEYLK